MSTTFYNMALEVRSEAGVVLIGGAMLSPSAARELANDLLRAAEKAQVHLSRSGAGMPEQVTLDEMKNA